MSTRDRSRAFDLLVRTVTVGVLVGAWGLQTFRQLRLVRAGTEGYLIGDWTISYAGGFVRRGLFGEMLGGLGLGAWETLIVLWAVQSALYAVMFCVAIIWAVRLPDVLRWVPLLLSPAFILFALHDFGGSHRKEILIFAALFVLAEAVRTGRYVRVALVATGILVAIAVFSHEANALLVLPLILLARWAVDAGSVERRFATIASVAIASLAALGLIVSVMFPGTVEQQIAICRDLIARGHSRSLCGGSLSYIGNDAAGEVSRVLDNLLGLSVVALPAMFASIPLLGVEWFRTNLRTAGLVTLPILPLFVVAIDWGRWIMLATVILTVLTVVGASRQGQVPDRLSFPLVVLFVSTWRMGRGGGTLASVGANELLQLPFEALRSVFGRGSG